MSSKHYAKLKNDDKTYQVYYNDNLILESADTLLLMEHFNGKDFPPGVYFGKSAVEALDLKPTDLSTHCPIKGNARYFTYEDSENGVWAYPTPISLDMEPLADYVAFDETKGFRVKAKD